MKITEQRAEPEGWLLVVDDPIDPSGAPFDAQKWTSERILGLSVLLRLALTAAAPGARAIALSDSPALRDARRLLADPRLGVPVIDEADRPSLVEFRSTGPSLRVAANVVVHRATLAALMHGAESGEATLSSERVPRGAGGPYGFEPIVVCDRDSRKAAADALLRSLRKPQDGWVSTHLNRKISLFLTRGLVSTPLRPNQVSLAILAVGLGGAWLASRGSYGATLGGAALFQAQSILDGCDGEMSRLTFRGSRAGEWLDTVGDDLTNYGFFAGAAWGLYTTTGRALYLALGAVTVACGIVGSGLEYRYLIRIGSGDLLKYPLGIGKVMTTDATERRSGPARLLDSISPLFKRDTFVFPLLGGAAPWARAGPAWRRGRRGAAGPGGGGGGGAQGTRRGRGAGRARRGGGSGANAGRSEPNRHETEGRGQGGPGWTGGPTRRQPNGRAPHPPGAGRAGFGGG